THPPDHYTLSLHDALPISSKGCRAAFGWFSILLLVSAAGCTKPDKNADTKGSGTRQITVPMMPKSKGNAYFISCRKGAEDAAKRSEEHTSELQSRFDLVCR